MITIKNVSKRYKDGNLALENISLTVEDGEFVYIVGKTGAGKSTLIKLLDGEEVPTKGLVKVNDINVGKLWWSRVPKYRRTIGVVYQDFKLLPEKTVFENVAFALEVVDMPTKQLRVRVRQVLKLVGLSDKAQSKPKNLSGGQIQRCAIARAIANNPKLLIADEPTGNLDPETSEGIMQVLEAINIQEHTTIVMVTHNTEIIKKHPRRVVQLESAHIAQDIPTFIVEKGFGYHTLAVKQVEKSPEDVIKDEIVSRGLTQDLNVNEVKEETKVENDI